VQKPLSLATLIFVGLASLSAPVRAADLTGRYEWGSMKIGGGGWVVGMDIHPTEPGLIYVRTDVSGAYRWNPSSSSWKQLVTSASMPADFVGYARYSGVDSLVAAPSDPNIAYMSYSGTPYGNGLAQIFRSTDRGETWKATTFKKYRVESEANGEGRQEGERLAVDPLDSNVVYYCPVWDSPWTTADGGATWSKIEAIPSGTPPHGVNTVVFGREPLDSGTKTKRIFITTDSAGIFKSSDGGRTWTNIAESGPKNSSRPRDAEMGSDGVYYVVCGNEGGATGSIWKYSPDGVWTDITPPAPAGGSKSYADLAVDPKNPQVLAVIANGGQCFVSKDQGGVWTAHGFHLNSEKIKWLGQQDNHWLSVGEIAFDPAEPGKLWFAEGFGVWWTRDLDSPDIEWNAASEGIEEACGNDVIAPPGGKPLAAMFDLGVFYFDNPDAYTARRSQPYFMSAWALDWCAADPKFIAGVFRNHLGFPPHPNSAGYSTDGGQTWSLFPAVEKGTAPAELEYGVIAVSANSKDKIVWSPAKRKLPYYTSDCGAIWKQSSFGGISNTGFDMHYSPQKALCADRVLPDTFYFYHPDSGIYRSIDGGAHFTKVGNPVSHRSNAVLKATPGIGGDLWFAEGHQGAPVGGLWHSTDGGASWKAVQGIEQAFNFGLGKAENEGGPMTIFVAGVLAGDTGIYRSTDSGSTWEKICTYPLGIYDWVDAMDGDKDVFGKVYLAFAGAGFAFGEEAKSK